jgi:hypothetical protein
MNAPERIIPFTKIDDQEQRLYKAGCQVRQARAILDPVANVDPDTDIEDVQQAMRGVAALLEQAAGTIEKANTLARAS